VIFALQNFELLFKGGKIINGMEWKLCAFNTNLNWDVFNKSFF